MLFQRLDHQNLQTKCFVPVDVGLWVLCIFQYHSWTDWTNQECCCQILYVPCISEGSHPSDYLNQCLFHPCWSINWLKLQNNGKIWTVGQTITKACFLAKRLLDTDWVKDWTATVSGPQGQLRSGLTGPPSSIGGLHYHFFALHIKIQLVLRTSYNRNQLV